MFWLDLCVNTSTIHTRKVLSNQNHAPPRFGAYSLYPYSLTVKALRPYGPSGLSLRWVWVQAISPKEALILKTQYFVLLTDFRSSRNSYLLSICDTFRHCIPPCGGVPNVFETKLTIHVCHYLYI